MDAAAHARLDAALREQIYAQAQLCVERDYDNRTQCTRVRLRWAAGGGLRYLDHRVDDVCLASSRLPLEDLVWGACERRLWDALRQTPPDGLCLLPYRAGAHPPLPPPWSETP